MLRLGPTRDALRVEKSYEWDGVAFTICVTSGADRVTLRFPIDFRPHMSLRDFLRQSCLTQLECLEDLWMSGELVEREGAYVLPYEKLDALDPEIRRTLALPEPADVDVSLRSIGAVGQPHFEIRPVLRHSLHGFLDAMWERRGCVMVHGEDAVLLPPGVVALLDALADRPPAWAGQMARQPEYAARVRTRALQAGARLDPYLEREQYLFPEKVGVDVSSPEPGTINLRPVLDGVPPAVNEHLDTVLPSGRKYGTYTFRDGSGRRIRVFVGDKVVEQLQAIRSRRVLRGPDAARFVQNPTAFLPEDLELDLADFSDRVKGLALRVYRAQPFISATPSGRGWFDVQTGVRLRNVSDPDEDIDIPVDEFRDIAERALQSGQEYVEWKGKWIQVPASMQTFLAGDDKLRRLAPASRVDVTRLPYVLEIFENVVDLEYSAILVEEKAKLDADVEASDAVPATFKLELRPFQRAGYAWMRRQHLRKLGCLLADEMGLGKTIQTLAFLCHLHERGQLRPSLVVAPLAIIDNWVAELERCLPPIVCYVHLGPRRLKDLNSISRADLVFTSYETLVRDQLLLGQVDWQVVVCDEAQKIKNYTAMATQVAKALKATIRLGLTGTPVENSLGELWCIGDFVQPGLLGSYREFRAEFELPLARAAPPEKGGVESRLHERLIPIYLRRTKKEVLENLPAITEHEWTADMTDLETELYLDVLARVRRREIEPLVAIRRLLDICAHPDLPANGGLVLDPGQMVRRSSKLQLTLRLMDQVAAQGEKAVVFCHLRNMQRILKRAFMWRYGLPECFILNGETQNRLDMVERFNRQPDFGAMIISPKAGGVGLNITGANHVIHYVRWWNPAVESQATARVHRIGQSRAVHVHYPILTHPEFKTADVILDELLKEKRELADSVLVPTSRLEISEKEFAARMGLGT
ncbi:MAG: DEAD/DEAH box helicase [Firmicutes bacterium]|nr:DEAD/DEAH box helicase [Bacillota bacterium]